MLNKRHKKSWCSVPQKCQKSHHFAFCNRMKTSRRCVSLPFRSISSMDTWWTGSWSRRTQPVPVQNYEVSWKGWSESPSGCLSAGCGPKLTSAPCNVQKNFTSNPPKSCTGPLITSWSPSPQKSCWPAWESADVGLVRQPETEGHKGRVWCQSNASVSGVLQQIDSCHGPEITLLLSLQVIFIQGWL